MSKRGAFPVLKWAPNDDADLCYYRVFRSPQANFEPRRGNQIASTVATRLADELAGRDLPCFYKVRAVDQSGNAGPVSTEATAKM